MNELKTCPNLIWKYNYKPGFDIKAFEDHIFKYGTRTGVSEADGGITTAGGKGDPHKWESLSPFLDWLQPKIETCLKEWAVWYNFTFISMSWANEHKPGGWTKPHEHGSTSVVVSCYVKQPTNGGNLLVESLLRERWTAYSRLSSESKLMNDAIHPPTIHDYWQEIPVQTNDVLLFPGWLNHKTQPNNSAEYTDDGNKRIVFTLNYIAGVNDEYS
jgi:hypothetical protein